MAVYLIHFDRKLQHAQHYIGFAEDAALHRRLAQQLSGSCGASSMMKAVKAAGIRVTSIHIWPNASRTFERLLKDRKSTPKLCPICNPGSALPQPTLPQHTMTIQEAANVDR